MCLLAAALLAAAGLSSRCHAARTAGCRGICMCCRGTPAMRVAVSVSSSAYNEIQINVWLPVFHNIANIEAYVQGKSCRSSHTLVY